MNDLGQLTTEDLLPPSVKDLRGRAFAAAIDGSAALDPYLACPADTKTAPLQVLWELARQAGVAGPLWQAMNDEDDEDRDRANKEALVNSAVLLQRRRGTRWAVEQVMRLLGYSDAYVLDRTRLVIHDGTEHHSGPPPYYESGFDHFGDYLIRLFIDEQSRSFGVADRQQAATLAAAWAPLHSGLQGFHARHVLISYVQDPAGTASEIAAIELRPSDPARPAQVIESIWITNQGPNRTINWRLNPAQATVPDVKHLALVRLGRLSTVETRENLPIIAMDTAVTYEGTWTLLEAR